MAYTEVKEKNGKRYYYRVKSIREGEKIKKQRIYLGSNLKRRKLNKAEKEADMHLYLLKNILTEDELKLLGKIKKDFSKEPKENFENRYEYFCSLFTYDSNAIEGNSLTLNETAHLLFDDIVPAKSLREVNETLNHKEAFDYMLGYKGDINKKFILDLHKLVIKKTLRKELELQIGRYRTFEVYIRGSKVATAKSIEVPKEMKNLLFWYTRNKNVLHPLVLASYFHLIFEAIHPFIDGNGRVGRLLMNFILHQNGYPMINIPNSRKMKYYKSIEEAKLNGRLRPFIKFLLDIMKKSIVKF